MIWGLLLRAARGALVLPLIGAGYLFIPPKYWTAIKPRLPRRTFCWAGIHDTDRTDECIHCGKYDPVGY